MSEISRRKFIQLSVIGGAAAAAGCDPKRETRYSDGVYQSEVTGQYGGYANRVYPYLNQPDGLQDGVPQYFATACRMCPAGCGLMVRTLGGRAVKIEGNPAHPVNRGATCARAQAALQHLYNPDRVRRPHLHPTRGKTETIPRGLDANPPDGRETLTRVAATETDWDTAMKRVTEGLGAAKSGVAILADAEEYAQGPTQARTLREFASALNATVYSYALLDDSPWRAAAQTVYGRSQVPAYQLDEADVIVSFGGDFLETWPSPVYYGRLFGEFRQGPRRTQGEHGRFVYIGPRLSMTAAKADLWLPCHPGTEAAVAAGIQTALGSAGLPVAQAAAQSGLTEAQIQGVADEMRRAGPRAVAVPGSGLMTSTDATAAFTAVDTLNIIVKSRCVGFGTAAASLSAAPSSFQQMGQLIAAMNAGEVSALLMLGQSNPVFTLPSAAGFVAALAKVSFIAALTPFEDETTAYADIVLPTHTFLEDWADSVPLVLPPQTRMATLQQPIIDPKFVGGNGIATLDPPAPWMDTRPVHDLFVQIAHSLGKTLPAADSRAAVRKTWAGLGQATLSANTTENDRPWVEALSEGGLWEKTPAAPNSFSSLTGLLSTPAAPSFAPGGFTLQMYPQIYFGDGRHANLGWAQETPDPMTMAVWNSWVEINLKVAQGLNIRTGDLVRLTSPNGTVDARAVPSPGIHPGLLAMPIGQGHTVCGRNAEGRGSNPLTILDPAADRATGAMAYSATQVTLKKIASAKAGYWPNETLVQAQDRPGGHEPEAVENLIHTTAREWKKAQPVKGPPKGETSMFSHNSPPDQTSAQ